MKLGPKEIKAVNQYFVRPVKNKLKEIFMKKGLPQLKTPDEIQKPENTLRREMFEDANKRFNKADGGRMGYYPGGSVEEYGEKIKESFLKGNSQRVINKELGFKNDRSTTIEEFINSAKKGLAPIKITKEELSKRPVTMKGRKQAGESLKRLQTFVENFKKKNNRLPSSQELRRSGNFDFYTIKNALDAGDVNILDSTTARAIPQQASTNEQLLKLSKDKDINNIFKSGKTTIKDIKKVKKVIGNVSDSVAADRLLQLASIYSETGVEDNRGLNIKPKFKNNAAKILKDSPYTGYIRNMNEALIGKSVGDPSIKGTKSAITESPDYKKTGIAKTYDIDEPLGVASSVNRGSTPYGIYGQIIDASKNKIKVGWDARKSQLELELQEAIQSKNKKSISDAIRKFNKEARVAENKFNEGRRKGSKKIIIPEVSLDKPSKTNANYKNLNDNYKKAFNTVHANQGYSFKIPADLKPITQIKQDLKNPKILSKVEKAAKLGDGRLYAKIPGITDLFEIAKTIPDDIKKAKYLKAGFKTLGVAAAPLVIYDTYKAFEQGKPVLEALEQGFIGTDMVGGTKRILSLTPEERTARSVVKQDALKDLNLDMPMGFGFIEGPTPNTNMTLPQAQQKMDSGIQRVLDSETQKNLLRSQNRGFGNAMADEFLAGGGIAGLSGGDPKGAMLTSMNPDKDGLPGLLKRGKKQ